MADLKDLFDTLHPLLKAYQPPFFSKNSTDKYFDLWLKKEIIIEGRKMNEVFFAGLIIQKDYVGFYYMPVYVEIELKKKFQPQLLALLKGKSCFHIKSLDAPILGQIEEALRFGFEMYQKRGWV